MINQGRRIASVAGVAVLLAAALCAVAPAGATTGGTPLDPYPAFVASTYHDFLGRVPHGIEWDASSYEDLDTVAGRSRLVSALSNSTEWVTRTVQRMYVDTLGREGDSGGVNYWVSVIRSRRASVARVASMLYSSSEYFTGSGHSDVRTWVDDLYAKILLRPGTTDPNGVAYWTMMTARVGRTKVAYAFFQSHESSHTRVAALYQTLLGRSPDQSGWDYWARRVVISGDLALAASLASSPEYYARAAVRYADAGPSTWELYGVGPGDHLLGGIALGPHEVGSGNVVCTIPCQNATLLPEAVGFTRVRVVGLADSGVIVGSAIGPGGNFVGLVWNDATSTPTVLPAPQGATDVLVRAMGASGAIVGAAFDGSGEEPYYWSSPDAQPTRLRTPSGRSGVWASGLSPSGEIFGGMVSGDTNLDGLVWATPGSAPTTLSGPAGSYQVQINAMAASGELVGLVELSNGSIEGLDWSSTSVSPSVLPKPSGAGAVDPLAISASGSIAGAATSTADLAIIGATPVVWGLNRQIATTLPGPPGYTSSWAVGFSSSGLLVGNGFDAAGDGHVLVWVSGTSAPVVLSNVS